MKLQTSRLLIGGGLLLAAFAALVVVFARPGGMTATPRAANVITITAKDMAFDLDTIKIKVGEPVTIRLINNDDMKHDFTIKTLDLHSDLIEPNEVTEVTFTPQQVGDYQFICSYARHAKLGMVGTLQVVS